MAYVGQAVGRRAWQRAGQGVTVNLAGADGSPRDAAARHGAVYRLEPGESIRLIPPPLAEPIFRMCGTGMTESTPLFYEFRWERASTIRGRESLKPGFGRTDLAPVFERFPLGVHGSVIIRADVNPQQLEQAAASLNALHDRSRIRP
jgi:hypothetical protein